MKQVNNVQRKNLDLIRTSCYLSPVGISTIISSLTLSCSDQARILKIRGALSLIVLLISDRFQLYKKIVIDVFTNTHLCKLMKDHKRFVAASSQIQNSVVPLLFVFNELKFVSLDDLNK